MAVLKQIWQGVTGTIRIFVPDTAGSNNVEFPAKTGEVALLGSSAASGESNQKLIHTRPWNMPWGFVARIDGVVGTSATGTTTLIPVQTNFTHTAGRRIRVTAFANTSISPAMNVAFGVAADSTTLMSADIPSASFVGQMVSGFFTSTGAQQSVYMFISKGASTTLTTRALNPWIVFEDIGAV